MSEGNKRVRDGWGAPFFYTYETTTQDGVELFWYVLTDEHEVEVYKFNTEGEAIKFINECEIKEVNVITVFHGRQVSLQKKESLCPAD